MLTAALVCGIGLLPWLSRNDPALTVLKARSADRDPTPEALRAVRDQLGLSDGPLPLLGRWLGGLLQGDAGRSWVSGSQVLPSVTQALGISLMLMAGALAVAVCTAVTVCARTLWLGSRRRLGTRRPGGTGSAVLAALPEFLVASVLASVISVQLGWLPALGWYGPEWMVLPSIALGLPAGAVLGRMLDDLLPGAFAEPWALAAAARGLPPRSMARKAVRRCVPGLLPNLGLFVVGLTGGAVAVEQIFDIPGLGQLTLRAALAQDLPVLQTGTLTLVLLAAVAGALARHAARLLTGPSLRDGALHSLHRPAPPARHVLPLLYGAMLAAVIGLGLPRDPLALDPAARLQAPSFTHVSGTDALGRDILARIAHGALSTLGIALAVSAAALVTGVLLGLLPRLSGPVVDTVNAVPPVLAGLLVTGVAGSGPWTPALAVAVGAWTPLAAHTSALLQQERATLHLTATRALGATDWYLLTRELLPAVLPPVVRHALLRLPGIALNLAALGFLGLGAQPPSPDWGLLLAENQPYVERAPWAVIAPAAVLALLGALAVTAAGGAHLPRLRRFRCEKGTRSPDEAAPDEPLAPPGTGSPSETSQKGPGYVVTSPGGRGTGAV
ncbi:ABC transporter permease subunit [Streptomyces sp. Ru72]|uniref:ABC transporter permease subunit n=1 Tax=Streptomyces sp. Ru72 TaxID=2080747 RepID=UPI0015E39D4B|nr:ABC transporter permease subunit [Streptomyces sp. Ru72]